MGALLRYLTTTEGCDLVIISRGEFFFVHKAIIAAHCPVLEEDACKSTFLDGEAYTLDAISPDVLRKVLTFMYTGDIPETFQSSLAASAKLPLNEKFPATDAFLVTLTVNAKPTTVNLNDGSSKAVDTMTNSDKWAILMAKQALMKDPYDTLPCKNSDEVFLELNIYLVAKQLEINPLKKIAMQKIVAWFENELGAGLPLSEDFHAWAGCILRAYEDFTKPFFGLCAAHLPVVEKDSALTSLLEKCNPNFWEMMMCVRTQWKNELTEQRHELQKSKEQIVDLKTITKQQMAAAADLEKAYQTKTEFLGKSLSLAEGRREAAQTMVQQLENLTRSLQDDLLKEKAHTLRLKENNAQKQKKLQTNDPSVQKLQKEVEDLKRLVINKEQALEQSKAANHKVKQELRQERDRLRTEFAKFKK
ncbi:uncharacterized protein A1O5_07952 [Cladophialophora psammophila CBS 110553]|uniref:BTB domain-containing protein n=1 Tax=Cladophialophora psammophila CBS 110553 TaxID=1182543 RepID=W9WLH8_9EURO|nr:uncharacterized protein A1O5_07952 [Cladophialophora psammophila CBS 110553]EXJ69017.1 hypothetical protein A1O5_07952 [Cladophialophora psammophila CBS 110553]